MEGNGTGPDDTADDRQRTDAVMARFLGRWTVLRNIFDVDSNWQGRFDGTADFSFMTGGLSYREEGELRFAGLIGYRATRSYQWRFPGGSRIAVHFEDGAPFHAFDLGDGRAVASHYCDPDQYDVAYDFTRWPEWRSEWRVEGPRKDYRMVTIYTRPGQPGPAGGFPL
jgi:hypothetical protein